MQNRPPPLENPEPRPAIPAVPAPPPGEPSAANQGLAVLMMSLFAYPGSGHFMVGQPTRGVVWGVFFTVTMFAALGTFAYNIYGLYNGVTTMGEMPDFVRMWTPCFVAMALCGLSWVGAAVDAWRFSQRR